MKIYKISSIDENDNKYMEAVNNKDMSTAQTIVDNKAKETGYTTKAYHGTRSNFTTFKEKAWFAINPKDAMSFGDVKPYYLKIENAVDNTFGNIPNPLNSQQAFNIEKGEPDFVVKYHKTMHFAPVYQVFKPSHVKSADPITYDDSNNIIPISKRFNSNNPDIRY